jgi:AraC family transcriptional regulator
MADPSDFIKQERPETILEIRELGAISMAELAQGAGSFPDPAADFFNLHLLRRGGSVSAEIAYGGYQFAKERSTIGDICISPPNTACDYHVSDSHQLLSFAIPSSLIQAVGTELNPHFCGDLSVLHSSLFRAPHLARRMLSIWHAPTQVPELGDDPQSETFRLAEVLVRMSMNPRVIKQRRLHLSPQARHRVLQHIDIHLCGDTSLAKLASIASLSEFHFLRAFKAEMGVTPHQYVMDQRVQYAKVLLQQCNVDLTSVALECGFASHQHLATAFSRAVGKTPSEYRRTTRYFLSLTPK